MAIGGIGNKKGVPGIQKIRAACRLNLMENKTRKKEEAVMSSRVENKVIAITGASSGIGEAAARLLAENGAKVVLGARRTERLESIAKDIRKKGGAVELTALDVRSHESVAAFVDFAREKFGRLDVIFNNAGVMPLSPMSALKTDEWDNMIDVNIRVTIISPGVIETELGSDITDDTAKGALEEFRKISLTPDAIAGAVLYAVSQPDNVDVNEIIVRPTASAF